MQPKSVEKNGRTAKATINTGASDLTSWHRPHRSGGAKRISGYAEVQ